MLDDLPEQMTVEQAVRLKQELGRSITFGRYGLNAREVSALCIVKADQWKEVRAEYKEWHKLTVPVLLQCGVCLLSVYGVLQLTGWLKIVSLLCGLLIAVGLGKREGHQEGYVDGYDAGQEAGVYRALGINTSEVAEIVKWSREMDMDDVYVSAFEKQP